MILKIIILLIIIYYLKNAFSYIVPLDSNLFQAKKFFEYNNNVSDIVISLTTMPRRLRSKSFKKVVEAMLLQKMRAKEIRINIPHVLKKTGQKYVVPKWLERLPVTIIRCEDYGPATKYIPTLRHYIKENPLQKILIYDDDAIMPPNTISGYNRYLKKFPCATLTAKGNLLKRRKMYIVGSYNRGYNYISATHPTLKLVLGILYLGQSYPRYLVSKNRCKSVDIIFGGAGYLIQPWMFDIEELCDYSKMPKEAFYVDDIVISGFLAKRGIKRLVVPELQLPKVTSDVAMNYISGFIKFPDPESLYSNHNRDDTNNNVMTNFFRKYWNN
jgi:hypothetical protein